MIPSEPPACLPRDLSHSSSLSHMTPLSSTIPRRSPFFSCSSTLLSLAPNHRLSPGGTPSNGDLSSPDPCSQTYTHTRTLSLSHWRDDKLCNYEHNLLLLSLNYTHIKQHTCTLCPSIVIRSLYNMRANVGFIIKIHHVWLLSIGNQYVDM